VSWLLPGDGWRKVWMVAGSASLAITLVGFLALRLFASQVFVREPARHAESGRTSGGWRRLVTGRNLTVWTLLALAGMVCGPWQNFLSSFLAAEKGYSLETIGRLWSIIGAVGLFSGFIAGLAADKAGVRIALAMSYAALACSALLVACHSELWQLQAAAICFGVSFYAIYGLIPAYISKTVEPRTVTTVFAVANVFLGLGTTLGNVIAGYFPSWSGSFRNAFIVECTLACVAILLTMTLHDERKSDPSPHNNR
jgi:predicted MFS family arabinose efflux permease